MSESDAFVDTNVILYLLSEDASKADRAEALIAGGTQISVQVLGELVAVMRRKLRMPWPEVVDFTAAVRAVCRVNSLTEEVHERGLALAQRLGLSIYDGTIVASALLAGCATLYSEDLQHGQVIERRLMVRNPFRA
ncbi:MAG: PIN domain-containing protein [Betaproteobacteria bacterium]